MNSVQSYILTIKQFYWALRRNPISWLNSMRWYREFSEIARALKLGGAHVFTLPMYLTKDTLVRAAEKEGETVYYCEKDYHGNPIDEKGVLVVREWGNDLPDFIFKHSGLITTVYVTKDRYFGLAGEFIEVFVSRKPM